MTSPTNANRWLESEIRRLINDGQTWSNGRPFGDLFLPPETLEADDPLTIPKACNIIGPRSSLFHQANLVPSMVFPVGMYLVRWEDREKNSNFSQQAHNVAIDCRNRSNGIEFSGAQGSRYSDICVEYAEDVNVRFSGCSHGATATNIWTKGTAEDRRRGIDVPLRGTGIQMINCSSTTIIGASLHRHAIGLAKTNCSNCQDIGTDFEKVWTALLFFNAVCSDSTSHHMLYPGGYLGTFGNSEHTTIRGTLRKGKEAKAEALVNGQLVTLSTQASSNDPKPFRLEL